MRRSAKNFILFKKGSSNKFPNERRDYESVAMCYIVVSTEEHMKNLIIFHYILRSLLLVIILIEVTGI